MRRSSLSLRLILVAAVWSVVALAIAGFILVELYSAASERAFDERINVYMTTLIGELSVADAEGSEPDPPGEARFRLPLSGWYWTVRDPDASNDVLFASPSLVGDALVLPPIGEAETEWRGYARGPAREEVRVSQRLVDFGTDRRRLIAVAGETTTLAQETVAFAGQVALTLSIFGLGLVAAIFLQVRIGLKPLNRLKASFAAVRRGEAEQIDEDLPSELAPLAVELNGLIASNRDIVERARAHVGNLAHALKTPLSVITNEVRGAGGDEARNSKLAEQAALMRQQIEHHLERARMAAQRRVIGVATETAPVVDALVRTMRKIHGGRNLSIEAIAPPDLRFRGERQDFEELLGNLIDNACKWAEGRVRVTLAPHQDVRRPMLSILIEDDGPGLSAPQREQAMQRGRRLDETVPGSGLGLSIVADLAALYGGRFVLEDTPLGGLAARLELPAV
ncbi:sensor histidine kinase [Breoghania sp. L-A4]|uniref:sensor histidine kinase n=1 Tax=Breoghania sp. L-A4 TaxID=2304600 RepID=UPI000E35B69F|nr:sensor histidine kinase [Breoghania sp. L-A4]AXS39976.1 histidine kinase [Breoghania sp. L-A4]